MKSWRNPWMVISKVLTTQNQDKYIEIEEKRFKLEEKMLDMEERY